MVLLIAGHPRSGTTLLRRVCNAHPDIVITHEVGNFLYLGSSYKEYRRQLIRRTWNRAVLKTLTLLWSYAHEGPGKTLKTLRRYVKEHVKESTFVVRYLFEMHKHRQSLIGITEIEGTLNSVFPGTRIVGDKLPDYVFSLDTLTESGQLACLVIYRDCRDVTRSSLEKFRTAERNSEYWRENLSTAEKVAKRWVRAIELMERYSAKLHVIRYEDFVQNTEQELEALAMWLAVDPEGLPKKMIRDTSVGRYKGGLSDEELGTVMEIAGPAMARLGYI